MDILDKLKILGMTSKYDVSCGGTKNENHSPFPGIYKSPKGDGGCSSLLKILMTNFCEYDCAYCVNRKSGNIKRTIFTSEEICKLTNEFYNKGYIDGLFLSSGILKNPDFTMELMLKAVRKLRFEYDFRGYIHLKIMPGVDLGLINEAIRLANRVSINLELPDRKSLHILCPQKDETNIFTPMKYIFEKLTEMKEAKRSNFFSKGQTTQLIVGATDDNDYGILSLSDRLYKKLSLKRVYYSAFKKVNEDFILPMADTPKIRETRLYQADWLIRCYNFSVEDLLCRGENLDIDVDPKTSWALKHIDFFPLEINKASYDKLIRIPGIGLISAKKILKERKTTILTLEGLKKMGIPLKRAMNFITINGKYYGKNTDKIENLKETVKDEELKLFSDY